MATIVVGAIGAVVGGIFGGPLGASIGWSIGAFAGNALFPNQQNIEGPRLSDLKLQGSTYGAVIPYVFGTDRISGQVIWQTDLIEHQSTSGGKGGGRAKTTTYTYSASFAILLCKGPMAGVVKLWADGRLVFDGTNTTQYPFTFYPGDNAQMPDPVMEAALGAGNVPAYRGYTYIVFEDLDLGPYFNRIPSFSALVTESIVHKIGRLTSWVPEYPDPDLNAVNGGAYVDSLGQGPRNPSVSYDGSAVNIWRYQGGGEYHGDAGKALFSQTHRIITKRFSELGNVISAHDTGPINGGTDGIVSGGQIWKATNYPGYYYTWCNEIPYERHPDTAPGRAYWSDLYSSGAPHKDLEAWYCTTDWVASWDGTKAYMLGNHEGDTGGTATTDSGASLRKYTLPAPVMGSPDHSFLVDHSHTSSANGDQWAVGIDSDGSIWVCGSAFMYHLDGDDLSVIASWDWAAIQIETGNNYHSYGRDIGDHPCFCNGKHAWVNGSQSDVVTIDQVTAYAPYITRITTIPFLDTDVIGDTSRIGPCFALGNGLVWIRDGLLTICSDKGGQTTLGAIVAAISEMEPEPLDATQYDVTELGDIVDGFKIGQQMSKRAAIEALEAAYGFDVVERDAKAVFVKRGKGPVLEIEDEDLGAVNEGGDPGAPIVYTRGDENDLPKSASVTFEDKNFDYQANNVPLTRQTGNAAKAMTLEVAIVMDSAKAKQIVQQMMFNTLLECDKGQIVLPTKYLRLDPTDVIRVQGIDYRIDQADVVPYSTITLALSRTQADAWSSGGSPGTESTGGGEATIVYPQHTAFKVMDVPYITDPAQQDVIYAAMSGIDRPGAGATLFKSSDGGTNYDEIASNIIDDAMGTLDNALPNFSGGNVFDEGSFATVTLTKGSPDLESTTRAGIFRGDNEALITVDGGPSGEFVQFRDATLTSSSPKRYDLAGLLRGLRGTEWAMSRHAVGDDFILYPAQTRLVEPYADHGLTRQFKAATAGQALASVTAQDFTSQGIPLAPYAPVHLGAGFNAGGDVLLKWMRRARFNNDWQEVIDVPLGETTESYRVRIFEDGTYQTVLRTEIVSTPNFTYTVAMQMADFGGYALGSLPVWGVAQIGALGPGYEAPTGILPAFVPVSGGGGPPPVDTGFLSTMSWATPARLFSHDVGSLETGSVWSIAFTTGSTSNPDIGHMVKISAAEWSGPPTLRMATLSPIRGDFGTQPAFLANAGPSTTITFFFGVGSGPVSTPAYPVIPLNTTWYLNIKTVGGDPGVECSMACDLNKTFV